MSAATDDWMTCQGCNGSGWLDLAPSRRVKHLGRCGPCAGRGFRIAPAPPETDGKDATHAR